MFVRSRHGAEAPLLTRDCAMITCDKILIVTAIALAVVGFLAWIDMPGLGACHECAFYFVLASLGTLLISNMFFKRPYCFEMSKQPPPVKTE